MPDAVPIAVTFDWDEDANAGYLSLVAIDDGDACYQPVVENPVKGIGDVVLDFNRRGQLLGVEFLTPRRRLPAGAQPERSSVAEPCARPSNRPWRRVIAHLAKVPLSGCRGRFVLLSGRASPPAALVSDELPVVERRAPGTAGV